MKRMTAKYPGTCRRCGARFPKGVTIDFDRTAPKNSRTAHADCSDALRRGYADAPEGFDADAGDGLVYVPGDNRPFARTRHGLRAGYEHTGRRCEDAPCCGCC